MRKSFLKVVSILLLVGLLFSMTACGGGGSVTPPDEPETDSVIPEGVDWLGGMCYILEERNYGGSNYDLELEAQLMKNLGVKTVRNWMHITRMLKSPTEINEKACEDMHKALKVQIDKGLVPIGMSHTNFNKGTAISGKPKRSAFSGSYYVTWLEDYYQSWYTLVKEFPEVTYWEIDNEVNNHDFMKNIEGKVAYTLQDMADIVADMFYYASRAIHDANPDAVTVMGGLTEVYGLGHGENKEFLQLLYNNILSGDFGYFYGQEDPGLASMNPDDYFQVACWHPYVHGNGFNKEKFKKYNDEIYQVILDNEGKDKPVFFTEIGFSNGGLTESMTASWVEGMFEVVREEMPYVVTINYFKLFDVAKETWTGQYSRYGLFYDPDPNRPYTTVVEADNKTILTPGAPKPAAEAFQRANGGEGSLTLLSDRYA